MGRAFDVAFLGLRSERFGSALHAVKTPSQYFFSYRRMAQLCSAGRVLTQTRGRTAAKSQSYPVY